MVAMSHLVEIDIAGMRVGLEIANETMRAQVCKRYAAFLATDTRPHTRVRVIVTAGARFLSPRKSPQTIKTYLDGNHLIFRAYRNAGWVNLDRGDGLLELAPETGIESFLRVLYAQLCLRAGGLLLAAAGVLTATAGYVFFGAAASGKTTVARWAVELGHTVLSDELVMLLPRDGTWRVFGAPFCGAAPRGTAGGVLAGMWALVPDHQHDTVALPPARAAALLAACAPFVTTDPATAQRLVQICAQVAAQVPVRELHFRRDSGWWSVLDETG